MTYACLQGETLEFFLKTIAEKDVAFSLQSSFSDLTTFRCGGKIAVTLFPDSTEKLCHAVGTAQAMGVRYVVLGRGSNVLAADGFFDGAAIVTTRLVGLSAFGNTVRACAGESCAKTAKFMQSLGLAGAEFLCCLPATVGGAVAMNAGCFGQCAEQSVALVQAFYNGKVVGLSRNECRFGRRKSLFTQTDAVVLSAEFSLSNDEPNAILARMKEMKSRKRATQPLDAKSAGCVLYGEGFSVSRLTDLAGLKGMRIGDAAVSEKHAGFVINIDKAAASDIYLLIEKIKDELWRRFGVRAETEVRLVNFEEGAK